MAGPVRAWRSWASSRRPAAPAAPSRAAAIDQRAGEGLLEARGGAGEQAAAHHLERAQRQQRHPRHQAEQDQGFHPPAAQDPVIDHANPGVDELIDAIGIELVTYGRDAMIEEVWRAALADVVVVPLHHQIMVWALRVGSSCRCTALDSPRFRWRGSRAGCALEPVILG